MFDCCDLLLLTLNYKWTVSLNKGLFCPPDVIICTFRSFSQTKRRNVERESHVTVWLGHYKGVFLLSLFFKNFEHLYKLITLSPTAMRNSKWNLSFKCANTYFVYLWTQASQRLHISSTNSKGLYWLVFIKKVECIHADCTHVWYGFHTVFNLKQF